MDGQKVVTRFAPSPTGFMHIGGLRTALFAYLWAKKNGGTFILRIEDTDKAREVAGSVGHIQETLRWLGLEWDAGVSKANALFVSENKSGIQSERLETYVAAVEKLIAAGHAYVDPYTHEQVEGFREQAQAEKRPFLFREHRPKDMHVPKDWYGRLPLRFKVPEIKRYTWHDAVRGELTAGEEALDDFILIKADGYPTYNLAHIVDDHNMRVTHVMRGDEFISSTPKFLPLYDALDIGWPIFVTLPPILRADKTKKLGKRDGAKDVLEYKKEGYLPSAFINFLAFVGWNPGTEQEIFTRDELVAAFDITQIQKAGAVMNEDKLDWYNKEYLKKGWDIQHKNAEIKNEITKRVPATTRALPQFSEERLAKIIPLIFDRIAVYADVEKICNGYTDTKDDGRGGTVDVRVESDIHFFFEAPQSGAQFSMLLYGTKLTKELALETLCGAQSILTDVNEDTFVDPEKIKTVLWPYAEAKGRMAVLWPLRVALTGKEKSPDPFTVASVLGRQETLDRIHTAITSLERVNSEKTGTSLDPLL